MTYKVRYLKSSNLIMLQYLKQKTQKQAEEAKSCMNVQNGKAIEHNRLNVLKSQTKPENHNCHNFVVLNKRKTFEKLGGKKLENIEEFGRKGFVYFYLFSLKLLICIL